MHASYAFQQTRKRYNEVTCTLVLVKINKNVGLPCHDHGGQQGNQGGPYIKGSAAISQRTDLAVLPAELLLVPQATLDAAGCEQTLEIGIFTLLAKSVLVTVEAALVAQQRSSTRGSET